jgi:hypothetical protein
VCELLPSHCSVCKHTNTHNLCVFKHKTTNAAFSDLNLNDDDVISASGLKRGCDVITVPGLKRGYLVQSRRLSTVQCLGTIIEQKGKRLMNFLDLNSICL